MNQFSKIDLDPFIHQNQGLSLSDIRNARERIKPFIHMTQILTSSFLNQITNAKLFFKCENFQRIGAFKIRGATNFVQQISKQQAELGVVTHSSGNHGQAVAAAAKDRCIKSTVVMPQSASNVKKKAVASYGAQVVICEDGDEARSNSAAKYEAKGAILVHPYGHPWIIAGQGTIGLELMDQISDLDVIIVPVGGGGCISGIAIAIHSINPHINIIGVEPLTADDAKRSLIAGKILPSLNPITIADGLKTGLAPVTYRILKSKNIKILPVKEEDIIKAMRIIWMRMKIIVEPSAAVSLAAVVTNSEQFNNKRIGIILTGGNVDIDKLPW